MTVYYVDDGGSNTSTYDTWAKASTSLQALDTAIAFLANDVIYVGHNSVDGTTYSADLTITGPTSGLPLQIFSATQGSSPVAYQVATSNQLAMTGAYQVKLDGAFYLRGLQLSTEDLIELAPDSDEIMLIEDCSLSVGGNSQGFVYTSSGCSILNRCTIDLAKDASTNTQYAFRVGSTSSADVKDLTFSNATYRTGTVFTNWGFRLIVNGADCSGFTNATLCELLNFNGGVFSELSNIKTAATWAPFDTTRPTVQASVVNSGPADAPTYLAFRTVTGDILSSTAIYRTGGATAESVATSWLVTTESTCGEHKTAYTPWIYDTISSTGSKTFSIYCTNDTADFDNSQLWIEVQYLDVSGSGQWKTVSSHRTYTDTAAVVTDDTTSTWWRPDGSEPSFTYKQKITSASVSVDQAGQFRARVHIGLASIASTRKFYIDPKVVVS